jgi:uncharacterized protein YndB with AHSA1/START domain
MQKLHFEILIHADAQSVWKTIVEEKKYREWTSVFHENSYFEGGWEKGDTIRFLTVDDKGEKMGMISEIAESKKYSFISIKHLGYIQNGIEDTTSDAVKEWTPAYENYSLTKIGNDIKFEVNMDAAENFVDMFNEMWPKALKKLKEIAER